MQYVCVPNSTVLLEDLFNEYCLFVFRGDTREDKGDMTQVQNQNESGGLMSMVGRPASWDGKALSWVVKTWSWSVDKYHQWRSSPVSQCSYIDGDPNITSCEVIYRSVIERSPVTPYRFKFHDPTHIITGIVCLPKIPKLPHQKQKLLGMV